MVHKPEYAVLRESELQGKCSLCCTLIYVIVNFTKYKLGNSTFLSSKRYTSIYINYSNDMLRNLSVKYLFTLKSLGIWNSPTKSGQRVGHDKTT